MNHIEYCLTHDCVKVKYPEEKDRILKFNNHGRMYKVPFVIYTDFECSTKPLNNDTQQDPHKSYTNQYQKHKPSGFFYYVKCFDDSLYDQNPVCYTKKSKDDDVV